MTFEELWARRNDTPKMYGGTYEIHYTDKECGKMVAFVEAWTEKKNGTRKAAIEKAQTEQGIDPATITSVKRYD